MELIMILSILRQYAPKLKHTHVIFTSMPYARQDKAWYDGELNMARTLVDMLDTKLGVSTISTIDAHFAYETWVGKYPNLCNASAVETLMTKTSADHPDIVFVTPDAGAQRRITVKMAAGAKKKRWTSFDVAVMLDEKFADVIRGKTVGVVDDIVSTGNTLVRFAEQARKLGAKKVVALLTHGVGENGISLIQKKFDGLYLTNTINRGEANVSVRNLVDMCILTQARLKKK
jgi:ribose-phosphate pyrophosphokinase